MNTFGDKLRFTSFGESHGIAVGGVLDGFPSGVNVNFDYIRHELSLRSPASVSHATQRVEPDDVELESDLALIAVVGRGMKQTRGTAGRIFSALAHAHVNVKMIDQGSSELNIIIGVREHDFEAAIQAIYDIFVNTQI